MLILVQPSCMLLAIYIYGKLIIPNSYLSYPLLIIFIYTIYLIYNLFTQPQTLSVVSKVNKHLSWDNHVDNCISRIQVPPNGRGPGWYGFDTGGAAPEREGDELPDKGRQIKS